MVLKIAIFTDCYLPYNSGVVHSIELLQKEVTSMGHEVLIFAPKYPNYTSKESGIYRFKSIPALTNKDYFLAVPSYLNIKDVLKNVQPDIIHTHHPFTLGWVGMYLARKLGLPLVYTCHTLYEYYSHYVPLPQIASKTMIRKLCFNYSNRCDIIIAPTASTITYLRQLGVEKPFKIIPTGVELKRHSLIDTNWLRNRFAIGPDEKILLSVSRLGPEKNLKFLLNCFVEVTRFHPKTKLILVGQGPQGKELKKIATNLGVGEKVIFTGLLPIEDVFKCYFGSDIFIFTSISETQGLVIAEAKSVGLPVVAINANGVSDMVQNGVDGFLVSFSKDQFVEKIILLLKNQDLRKEFSGKALINAKDLSSKKYALDLIDLYYSLIKTSKKSKNFISVS